MSLTVVLSSPAHGSHGNGEVPAERKVPALGERIDGPALVQDDHQVRHLKESRKPTFIYPRSGALKAALKESL